MSGLKFGVIVFPGSNCSRDVAYVTRDHLGCETRMVWHRDTDVSDLDVIVIPGGFSYGDYLRCGAIAQFSPVMRSVIDHANSGKPILGICNGFQILTEVGLLPGALIRNRGLHFICETVSLTIERRDLFWTRGYAATHEPISVPIAHGEGRYFADADQLKQIEDNGQVVFRYCDSSGAVTPESNPNGSLDNIAGICNAEGNVVGMMPHPERASDRALGSEDGLAMFAEALTVVA
ncbi:MAG: phosphoribosylformylglycinamidine synthase subunit PurQ [Coleofasciculaceae cyanobacterium RL_1_1]|nr:phosphoribosylformylglycinamidine synthase subunit PurQ [Coleofasciculaceae cyanobacterium RL_1_1]